MNTDPKTEYGKALKLAYGGDYSSYMFDKLGFEDRPRQTRVRPQPVTTTLWDFISTKHRQMKRVKRHSLKS